MKQYLELLQKVLKEGHDAKDRTGVGTTRLFGTQLRFDLQKGFPLLTTKKMFYKGIIHELLWMLSGSKYINYLQRNDVHIWDNWADWNGYVGPLYGYQWRFANGIDQLQEAITNIKANPYSRRIIVNTWNIVDLPDMALPPCHILYQFHPNPDTKELSISLYMRSADCFLGLPFDIGLYALLLSMVAQLTDYKAKDLIISIGDCHIYNNHKEQVFEQLSREPLGLPTLKLNSDIKKINDFKFEDIQIINYKSHSALKGEVAV